MIRTYTFFFLILILASNHLKSQDVKVQGAALEALLCKTWTMDYALLGDKKEVAPPDERNTTFQFLKNKTVIYSTGRKGENFTIAWRYNATKKIVELITHGKVGFTIVAITDTELTMTMPDVNSNVDKIKEMQNAKIVLKVK